MIPKILHVAWIGEDGTRPDGCIDSWRAANPGFELRIWGNDELSQGTWRTRGQMKALLGRDLTAVMDCLRYEVLARYGGIAVDALSIAARPIPQWILEADALALWVDEFDQPGELGTAFLGADPADGFFDILVGDIGGLAVADVTEPVTAVGRRRLTATWRRTRHPLSVYPSHYLAPTYGADRSYHGGGVVIGELIRPERDTLRPDLDDSGAFAVAQSEALSTLTLPTHVEGAPPLTSSFTLPPILPPDLGDTPSEVDMSEKTTASWSEIAAGIRGVGESPGERGAGDRPATAATHRFRLVVATDWSSATVPLAVLRSYAVIVPSDAPVDLVYAVPAEPTEEDAACVQVLLEGIDGASTAGIVVESFEEAAQKSCYGFVAPGTDVDRLVVDVATFVTTMHDLATMVGDPARLAAAAIPVDGPNPGLSRRFAEFSAALTPHR